MMFELPDAIEMEFESSKELDEHMGTLQGDCCWVFFMPGLG